MLNLVHHSIFTFLVWLLLPRWPSFECCFFLSFCVFVCFYLQPQPNKSPDDLFIYSTAWWKPAEECQSLQLQHTHCVWKLHEGGTTLCPKQFLDEVNDIIGFLGGVAICNLTSLGFCIVLPVLCSLFLIKTILNFPVVWYLKVCKCANALFEYDCLTYVFVVKIF